MRKVNPRLVATPVKSTCVRRMQVSDRDDGVDNEELPVRPIDTVGCLQGVLACRQAILTAQDPASVACRPPKSPAAFPKAAVRSDPSQRTFQGRRCLLG